MKPTLRYWAVVPAAGVGRRMGSDVPKQYLELAGRPVIAHALQALLDHPSIARVVVALSAEDGWWPQLELSQHPGISRVMGGAERADSVLNGILALTGEADDQDWLLVHDAARPCLRLSDLELLIERLQGHPVGGLLGVPLHDTIKRAGDDGSVLETLPREKLWRAFTPQMFRYGKLRHALQSARERGLLITDEASAIEQAGGAPLLVEGRSDNLKITCPQDLVLARHAIQQSMAE